MLVLRLLLMVLTIICLMDGHAEVSSSTTGMRNGGDSPAVKPNKTDDQILDRKKKPKKPKKPKKTGKKKGKKPKPKPKPKPTKPVTTTPLMTTSTLKTTTILTTTTTTETTTPTSTPKTTATTTETTTETTTSTARMTTTTATLTTTEASTPTASTITTKTTKTTATTSSPPTTAATTADLGAGGECEATNGKPCIFPFKDGNEEYNECKNEGGKYFWCATSVYDSGKYKHWSYCPEDRSCPLEGDGECRATNNKPCVFPFKDGNKEYNECADHSGHYFWCATGTNSAGKYTAWSKCPKDGSCPLPQKTTTPAMTPAETAATTTLLAAGTSTAPDEIENKVVSSLKDLVKEESKDGTLEMLEAMHKITETIIEDLKEQSEDNDPKNIESNHTFQGGNPQSQELSLQYKQGVKSGKTREIKQNFEFVQNTVSWCGSISPVSDAWGCCSECQTICSDAAFFDYSHYFGKCYCYKKLSTTEAMIRENIRYSAGDCDIVTGASFCNLQRQDPCPDGFWQSYTIYDDPYLHEAFMIAPTLLECYNYFKEFSNTLGFIHSECENYCAVISQDTQDSPTLIPNGNHLICGKYCLVDFQEQLPIVPTITRNNHDNTVHNNGILELNVNEVFTIECPEGFLNEFGERRSLARCIPDALGFFVSPENKPGHFKSAQESLNLFGCVQNCRFDLTYQNSPQITVVGVEFNNNLVDIYYGQEFNVKCKEGSFKHELLLGNNEVQATCGLQLNLFTVWTTDGDYLTDQLKDVDFECGLGNDCLITQFEGDRNPVTANNVYYIPYGQTIKITCPQKKFSHEALSENSAIFATCGPRSGRFTVSTVFGQILSDEITGNQFMCDPCPYGFIHDTSNYINNVEKIKTLIEVPTIRACKEECDNHMNKIKIEKNCGGCHCFSSFICQAFVYMPEQSKTCILLGENGFDSISEERCILCKRGNNKNRITVRADAVFYRYIIVDQTVNPATGLSGKSKWQIVWNDVEKIPHFSLFITNRINNPGFVRSSGNFQPPTVNGIPVPATKTGTPCIPHHDNYKMQPLVDTCDLQHKDRGHLLSAEMINEFIEPDPNGSDEKHNIIDRLLIDIFPQQQHCNEHGDWRHKIEGKILVDAKECINQGREFYLAHVVIPRKQAGTSDAAKKQAYTWNKVDDKHNIPINVPEFLFVSFCCKYKTKNTATHLVQYWIDNPHKGPLNSNTECKLKKTCEYKEGSGKFSEACFKWVKDKPNLRFTMLKDKDVKHCIIDISVNK